MILTNNGNILNYTSKNIGIWITVFVLNMIDAFLTIKSLNNPNNHELNPIMNILIQTHPLMLVAGKVVVIAILVYIVYKYISIFPKIHDVSCYYLVIFFFLIDINNLVYAFG